LREVVGRRIGMGRRLQAMRGHQAGPEAGRTDQARLWRTDDLGGLELLCASYVSFVFTPHTHESFLIALTEEGVGYPIFRRDQHPVRPGDVFVLNPEESHAGGPATDAPWGYRAIYPTAELLLRLSAEFAGRRARVPEFAGEVVRDRAVADRLRRFHLASEQPHASQLQRESYLAEALVWLVRRHGVVSQPLRPAGREHAAVTAAREYLDAHIGDNVSLVSLAAVVGLSPFHLCRVFREGVGLTPHAYQDQLRVRRAKLLLAQQVPIAQAAVEAGFYDQAHLTRHFKRVFGITPGRYVAARRGRP
jgi:AraC-like DNA-binding protein